VFKLLLAACVPVVLLGYAWLVEPYRVEVTEHTLTEAGSTQDSIRIVQLSDLHLNAVARREQSVAQKVSELAPDLIVLSGDVIDRADRLDVLDEFLSLIGPAQKVAVLGNWEHWSRTDLNALRSLYEDRHGVRLLVNEVADFRFGKRELRVFGLDDFTAGNTDVSVLQQAESSMPSIVIQHSPGWFQTEAIMAEQGRFALCLAGHTHGGQVTLFGTAIWKPPGSGDFSAGRYEHPMCPIHVSRGIGTSLLPLRFGARPEIAVFDL
jgi:predicted MPP superfamily phosphohydrolase